MPVKRLVRQKSLSGPVLDAKIMETYVRAGHGIFFLLGDIAETLDIDRKEKGGGGGGG